MARIFLWVETFVQEAFATEGLSGRISLSWFTGAPQLFTGLILIFVFLYGITIGRTRAVLSLLAVYAAYVLTVAFPFTDYFRGLAGSRIPDYLTPLILFISFYVSVLLILNIAVKNRFSIGDVVPWQVFIISVFQVGLIVAILIHFLPAEKLPGSLDPVKPYIATGKALFMWAACGLAILPFMRAGRRSID